MILCFFFSSRRRHTRFDCDWSSDVCSSDLRSYSTPARPSSPASPTTPSSPSPALTQPSPSLQRPSFFGGLMGGIAGFALGGLLGSMLFGGMGGGFRGGIGLLELLLIGGAALFLFRLLPGRPATQP